MNIPRREPLAQGRLERVERELVAAEVQVRFADEAVPAPPAAALIGETDLFRMAKPVQIVDEQPHGAGMAIFELIEDLPVVDNTVERRLTRDIGHGANALTIVDDAASRFVIHLVHRLKQRPDDLRLRRIPVYGRRKLDPGRSEIVAQRRERGIADEVGHRRHVLHLLSP